MFHTWLPSNSHVSESLKTKDFKINSFLQLNILAEGVQISLSASSCTRVLYLPFFLSVFVNRLRKKESSSILCALSTYSLGSNIQNYRVRAGCFIGSLRGGGYSNTTLAYLFLITLLSLPPRSPVANELVKWLTHVMELAEKN